MNRAARLGLRLTLVAQLAGLLLPDPAAGDEIRTVVILRPLAGPPVYEQVAEGLKHALAPDVHIEILTVSPGPLPESVEAIDPDLLVPLGTEALESARSSAPDRPRVFALAEDGQCGAQTTPGETGLRLQMNVSFLLDVLLRLGATRPFESAEGFQTIGFLYPPGDRGCEVRTLEAELEKRGMKALGVQVDSPRMYVHQLRTLSRKIDALFIVPAPEVTSADSLRFAILFGLQTRRPVVAYNARLATEGALLGERIDPQAIAEEAAELIVRVLAGTPPGSLAPRLPRPTWPAINERTARRLRMELGEVLPDLEGGPR